MTVLAFTGVAAAQVVAAPPGSGAVNVTTMPSSNGITAGASNTSFGTIQLSGNNGGMYSIASLPVTVTPGSGAAVSALSNCQVMNANQTLTSGNNVVTNLQSGLNTFTFDTPLLVNSATTTLSVNCNVAAGAASGTTFQFVAGTPILSPGLGVMLNTIPTVSAGTQNGVLAIITLDGTRSGANTTVSSIPLTLTFNGSTAGDFTNCSLRSASNLTSALNTGANAMGTVTSTGANTIRLDTPLSIAAGGGQLLALTCNVSSATPAGSSVTVSVDPATVATINAASGSAITPTTSVMNSGTAPTFGTVSITAPGTTTTTPGVPNTGAGGNAAMNMLLLASSGIVLALGGSMLALRRKLI
jgi:hypothetical protein